MTSAQPGVSARTAETSMPCGVRSFEVAPALMRLRARGELAPRHSPHAGTAAAPTEVSLHFDRGGLLRLDLGLRYVDCQHAILGFRADRGRIDAFRKRETAREAAVEALDLVELLILLLILLPPLTAHGEHAVVDRHLDILFLDGRQGRADQILLSGLADVG